MTRGWRGRLVWSLVVSFALAVGAPGVIQGLDNDMANSVGSSGYRGIVSANFDSGDAREEIVGDFGTAGVWAYHLGTWTQLTPLNPDSIFAVQWGDTADWELIADFDAAGLWMWDYSGWPGTWTRLTAANPGRGLGIDDDGDAKMELQIMFAGLGLWRYDLDTATWSQLTALVPTGSGLRTALVSPAWPEVTWRFTGQGVWYVYWSSGHAVWRHLGTSQIPNGWAGGNFVDPSGTRPADELVAYFLGLGTWVYGEVPHTWTHITGSGGSAMAAVRFGSDADSELVFVDWNGIPWVWNGASDWRRLSWSQVESGHPVAFDADGRIEAYVEDELAADFGTLGLWRFDYTSFTWTQLTASNPEFMVRSDYYGDTRPTALIAWFGPAVGLWLYDSGGGQYPAQWHKLADTIPDYWY